METSETISSEILNGKSPPLAIYEAAANGKEEELKKLIESFKNYTQTFTAIHYAVQNHRSDVVVKLLSYGAVADVCDVVYGTPLHMAVKNRDLGIGNLLINNPFDDKNPINLDKNWTSEGTTALHIAVENGDFEFVKTLVAKGASLDLKNILGNTPLHIAVINGHLQIAQFLIHNNAKADISNSDGQIAYEKLYEKWKQEGCDSSDSDQITMMLLLSSKGIQDFRHERKRSNELKKENASIISNDDEKDKIITELRTNISRYKESLSYCQNSHHEWTTLFEQELEKSAKLMKFMKTHLMPDSLELSQKLEAMLETISIIEEDYYPPSCVSNWLKEDELDYKKLEMDILAVKVNQHLGFEISSNDKKESIIEAIREVRPLFSNRTNEDFFNDIKRVQIENGNTFKSLTSQELKDRIAKIIAQDEGKPTVNSEIIIKIQNHT